MKYNVTVQGMAVTEKVVAVECATVEEAQRSAADLARRLYPEFNQNTLKVLSVEEGSEKSPVPVGTYAAPRGGYLRSLI